MNRMSLAVGLFLFCGFSVMAQTPKLDVATPQPPAVVLGNGLDAQQVTKIVGGKGGNSTDPGGHPGVGSSVLIQAGDGGDGPSGTGINGAGGSIILLPGAHGSLGDSNGAAGAVGIGTLTPLRMLSVRDFMNIDQGDTSVGGPDLSFGSSGGSGIGSERQAGGTNLYGLDLYTNGFKRISISNGGAVAIFGTLTKPAGSFKIDHPVDPENKYLSHSFVESPDMKNIYDGVARLDANGEAMVELPDWFEALNEDFRYQLTAVGKPSPSLYVAEEIHHNRFKISGGSARAKVCWQVTGTRHDAFANAHRILVEENKPAADRGKLLYPREQQMSAERASRTP
jgi:hypothetical protein